MKAVVDCSRVLPSTSELHITSVPGHPKINLFKPLASPVGLDAGSYRLNVSKAHTMKPFRMQTAHDGRLPPARSREDLRLDLIAPGSHFA